MIYNLYARCEVDCDGGRIATSQVTSYRLHKMSDEQGLFRRKQSTALFSTSHVLRHVLLRFLQILELGHACIFLLLLYPFRFVCIVSCFLGTVFPAFFFLFRQAYFFSNLKQCCNKLGICLNDHRTFVYVLGSRLKAFLYDTIYKFSCKPLLRSGRSLTC